MIQQERIVYVGGKSGGHIIPALTLAREATTQGALVGMIALDGVLDTTLLREATHLSERWHISLPTIYPKKILVYPHYALSGIRACIQIWKILREWKPTLIIATGGAISLLVTLIAWLQKIPIHLYNLDHDIGNALRYAARYATQVYVVFPETRIPLMAYTKSPVSIVPYPLRFQKKDLLPKDIAKKTLGLPTSKQVLVVFGGSQGAAQLNSMVIAALNSLPEKSRSDIAVLHQTGSTSYEQTRQWYISSGYMSRVIPYTPDVNVWLSAADLIITRAGSGALHEAIISHALKIYVIPLILSHNQHQLNNSISFAQRYPERVYHSMPHDRDALMQALRNAVLDSRTMSSTAQETVPRCDEDRRTEPPLR